jgi:A/G-specific adenine glycosylase
MITQRKVLWAGCKLARQYVSPVTDFPWRQQCTPYRIFLAEILLVRTRSDVVARVYNNVFEKYPNVYMLAKADEDELREVLHPLGLSKRVPYFVKAARFICNEFSGELPNSVKELQPSHMGNR